MKNIFRTIFSKERKQENSDISSNVNVLTEERHDTAADYNCHEEFERCVMCGELTGVPVSMPIEWREDYEPGIGQMCIECSMEMRKVSDNENMVMHAQVIKPLNSKKTEE